MKGSPKIFMQDEDASDSSIEEYAPFSAATLSSPRPPDLTRDIAQMRRSRSRPHNEH